MLPSRLKIKSVILPSVSFFSLTTGFSLSFSARYPLAISVACKGVSAISSAGARSIHRTTVDKTIAGNSARRDLFMKLLSLSENAPSRRSGIARARPTGQDQSTSAPLGRSARLLGWPVGTVGIRTGGSVGTVGIRTSGHAVEDDLGHELGVRVDQHDAVR